MIKHKFDPVQKNETMKQIQFRLEKSKELFERGVPDMIESPYMFRVNEYDVYIQYCFCTCDDYMSKLRICKHINAVLIYFAVKHGMKELPNKTYIFRGWRQMDKCLRGD